MSTTRINLLPPERTRALVRAYYLRFSVVALTLVGVLAVVGAVLMLPTHVYLTDTLATKRASLNGVQAIPVQEQPRTKERVLALETRVTQLEALKKVLSASALVREALAVPHESISIFNLNYLSRTEAKAGTLMISGTAASRETLYAYQRALQAAPFAAVVDLPVSAYAKDTNIPFTITVSLAL